MGFFIFVILSGATAQSKNPYVSVEAGRVEH